MLDENGKYSLLTLSEAQTNELAKASAVNVAVEAGSVEEQIMNWLAQDDVNIDSAFYAMYVKMFNPTGTDIDLQNPGTPRLQPTVSNGFIKIDNSAGSENLTIALNSIFTAPNGNTYTNLTDSISVLIGEIGYLSVSSVATGKSQNLPAGQTFSSSYTGVITNPQPFVDGADLETDTEYLNRLIYLKSNNASVQSTPAAEKELLDFYQACKIYINNSSTDYTTPVPVPTGGYIAVVLFASGVNAGANEISKAISILLNRFEFGNIIRSSTTLHPILSGTVYTGTFPQLVTVAPAQYVQSTITATLTVSFSAGTDSSEKNILATSLATAFVQNLLNFYGGTAGEFNMVFQEFGSPVPSPVLSTPSVVASERKVMIAPVISIEQIRAFISDETIARNINNMNYLTCDSLIMELDPQVVGESVVTLNIAAPSGGSVSVVDFIRDSLFSDNTSWYDRYIYIDPSLITITVEEA